MDNPCGADLIYFHVTKAAGTSIENALHNYFGENRVLLNVTKDDYLATPPCDIRKYKALAGHISHDLALPYITNKTILITVLREPRNRIRSLYNYFRSLNGSYPVVLLAKKYEFFEWINCKESVVLDQIQNSAIRQFTPGSYWNIHNAANPDLILEYALKFIKSFNLIGTVENLEDFSIQLHKTTGIKFDCSSKLNRSNQDFTSNVSDAYLDEWLMKMSSLDLAFYNRVKEL